MPNKIRRRAGEAGGGVRVRSAEGDAFRGKVRLLLQTGEDFRAHAPGDDAIIESDDYRRAVGIAADGEGLGENMLRGIGGFGIAAIVAVEPDGKIGRDVNFGDADRAQGFRSFGTAREGGKKAKRERGGAGDKRARFSHSIINGGRGQTSVNSSEASITQIYYHLGRRVLHGKNVFAPNLKLASFF